LVLHLAFSVFVCCLVLSFVCRTGAGNGGFGAVVLLAGLLFLLVLAVCLVCVGGAVAGGCFRYLRRLTFVPRADSLATITSHHTHSGAGKLWVFECSPPQQSC
jgi:hypothetical protein